MAFNEVLSQTMAMLQQHGQVSYRALKRQLALDDAFLDLLALAFQRAAGGENSHIPPNYVVEPYGVKSQPSILN